MSQGRRKNTAPQQEPQQYGYGMYSGGQYPVDPGYAPNAMGYPPVYPNLDTWQQQQQHQPMQGDFHMQGAYPPGPTGPMMGMGIQGGQAGVLSDPMAAMAMQYGQTLAGQGKEIVNEKFEKYIAVSRLKYYFAVDTAYVAKKLILLFFPFTHKDWSVRYNQDEPVAPRFDVNAPDLYIPSMAFVTYVLIAGYLLGLQEKFSPEQLGKQASSALGWVGLEITLVLLTHYVLSIAASSLKFLDMVAFCSYKFVCMIAALLCSLVLKAAYLGVLAYSSCSLMFFLMRTLRMAILTKSQQGDQYGGASGGGQKRSLYLVGFVCLCQPLMMYWLTYHLAS